MPVILFDGVDQVQFFLDGSMLGSATRQPHFQRNGAWVLELGHFDGDLDDLRISSVVREVSNPPTPGGGTDIVNPSVAISAVVQQQINAPLPVSVSFSEVIYGLSDSKFLVHNGSLADLTGSGASYSFTVTPLASGVVSISLPGGRVSDAAGNGNVPSNLLEVEFTDPLAVAVDAGKIADSATIALYPMDGNADDVSGNGFHLTTAGSVSFANDNLGWMANASGSVARFGGPGDTLVSQVPLKPGSIRGPMLASASITPRSFHSLKNGMPRCLSMIASGVPIPTGLRSWRVRLFLWMRKLGLHLHRRMHGTVSH
jgi:predicted secreted protein